MDGCWIHSEFDIHVPMFPLPKMHVLELYMRACMMQGAFPFSGVPFCLSVEAEFFSLVKKKRMNAF